MKNNLAYNFDRHSHQYEYWRWRLIKKIFGIEITATVGEAARAMAMRAAGGLFGDGRLDPCLHGPANGGARMDGRHLHAFWLPQDEDGDGVIDHLAIVMEGGATERAHLVLSVCRHLRVHGVGTTPIVPVAWASPADAPARVWRSATPFVGPRFAARRFGEAARVGLDAAQQLKIELRQRRTADNSPLPDAAVFPMEGFVRPAAEFRLGGRARRGDELRPRGWFEIVFREPVRGPLAFGLGAHFGLGQFTAVRAVSSR